MPYLTTAGGGASVTGAARPGVGVPGDAHPPPTPVGRAEPARTGAPLVPGAGQPNPAYPSIHDAARSLGRKRLADRTGCLGMRSGVAVLRKEQTY